MNVDRARIADRGWRIAYESEKGVVIVDESGSEARMTAEMMDDVGCWEYLVEEQLKRLPKKAEATA